MVSYVILLRGVMPTGKNRVPMAELRSALCKKAELFNVRTYIQSGNIVAQSELDHGAVEQLVHDVILKDIGANITVIAITHEQLNQVMDRNPFPTDAASRTYFTILASTPVPPRMDELRNVAFAPDAVITTDRTLYTLYATKHSDSKFNNNFFEAKLKVAATTRNFNTMTRLVEMSKQQ